MEQKKEIYLDNSATTMCSDSVREIVARVMTEDYGNPSSLHKKGMEAEQYIKEAKERIKKVLKASDGEIIFTSGGTESNNLAVLGTAFANQRKGKHIITTKIEHPSVKQPMEYLRQQGFEITYLPTDSFGVIDLATLKQAVRDDTILVSIMHVNNEIGSIQPVETAAAIVKEKNSQTYVHSDAVQSFGKLKLLPKRMGIDMLSVSGHKIHGPKGIGFLYTNAKVKISPILFGGGQQKDLRSGTENVPGIAGLGQAVMEVYERFEEQSARMYALRNYFIGQLQKLEGVTVNGCPDEKNAPHIVSVTFDGLRSEVLLHALEEKGIYVSAGSACASHKQSVSDTLAAIGKSKEEALGTLRFSFSKYTDEEQLNTSIAALSEILPFLRKYRRY